MDGMESRREEQEAGARAGALRLDDVPVLSCGGAAARARAVGGEAERVASVG